MFRNNYTFEDTEFEGISENAKVGYFKFKERLRKWREGCEWDLFYFSIMINW